MDAPEHMATALERALARLVRTGRVASVNAQKHTARVAFAEDGDYETFDLQVLCVRGGDYALPEKDAPVVCLVLPGPEGVGFVLGTIYTDADAPPLDDAGKRSVASDDLRLGAPDADDKVALSSKVKEELNQLQQHFQAVESILTGAPINEPGNGAPSALQLALKAAIIASEYPTPGDVGAEKVSAK